MNSNNNTNNHNDKKTNSKPTTVLVIIILILIAGYFVKFKETETPPVHPTLAPDTIVSQTPVPTPVPTVPQTPAPATPSAVREATTELVFMSENGENKMKANLHTGDGYSIYLPEYFDEFSYKANDTGNFTEEVWNNNTQSLKIVKFIGKSKEDVKANLLAEKTDCNFADDGTSAMRFNHMDVTNRLITFGRICESKSSTYLIVCEGSFDAEHFSNAVGAAMDTIEFSN